MAFSLLGRLVNAPDGFAADPAFQTADGESLLAEDGAVFVGNSQGGVLGGAVSAVTDEWERAVLGVPGVGYNLLLPRSSDWPEFQAVFDPAYPDPIDRVIVLELIQLLWDRGENSAYVQHLTADPYEGVPAKTVLLVEAFGDHQVANVSTAVLARTIGAAVTDPALEPGRSDDVEPYWGITVLDGFPATTSVLSVWDYGTPAPPTVNLPAHRARVRRGPPRGGQQRARRPDPGPDLPHHRRGHRRLQRRPLPGAANSTVEDYCPGRVPFPSPPAPRRRGPRPPRRRVRGRRLEW